MDELERIPADRLPELVRNRLREAGGAPDPVEACVRALMHASLLGVDSHGVRLTEHYCKVMRGGRVNPDPKLAVERRGAAVAIIDADNGLGHYAAYRAISLGAEIAAEAGVAAIGIRHSSHLGAAGAYVTAAAEQGFFAFATTNTDKVVALHGGAEAFHGTNPLAFAAPVTEGHPWLFDMATSSIPLNRVLLYRTIDKALPPDVAADSDGQPTTDPHRAEMLLPLGGMDYGYKGAGLAGLATVLTGVLLGTTLDQDFIAMTSSTDVSTPRNMGHFFFLLDPGHFAGRSAFGVAMATYMEKLRAAPAREGAAVMAPGDREWQVKAERLRDGIPLDPQTARFLQG